VGRGEEWQREPRKRAPKGAVDALVTRALANGGGQIPDGIKALAANADERMIAVPSIRAHLRKGEKEGKYIKRGGRWYRSATEAAEKQETADPNRDTAQWPEIGEHS
jgi:hypothetical protein